MDKAERENHLRNIVQSLPDSPGCYQYLNDEGVIIYVGKAKNLKKRVSSYFLKEQQTLKTKLLVTKIADIHYIVVNSETDALLLENNLIKKYKPRYNVLLKDDKTYPSICISNEFFPRVFKTRRIIKNAGTFYGPYSNSGALHAMLSLIKELYPLRTCRLNLNEESIKSGKFNVCLQYHIKNCKAPCVGKISRSDYTQYIDEIRTILKGDIKRLTLELISEMKKEAGKLNFEEAQRIKERFELIELFRTKSEVVSSTINNVDVFAIESDEKSAFINFLHISNGCINQASTIEYQKKLDESDEELLSLGIVEIRERLGSDAKEIVIPFDIGINIDGIEKTIPQRGDKLTLLKLSALNVKQYRADRLKQSDKLNPQQKRVRLMKEIQEQLKLDKLPIQIESFDNSNIQGTDAVSVCVVFKELLPAKNEYRKYILKESPGNDDYASMREVARRRYSKIVEEGGTMPNLIVVDGGKGQMEAVRRVVEDELGLDIVIAGLVKDSKHRTTELIIGKEFHKLGLKQHSTLLKLMTQIQDEVHRFAIKFHRDKRSKRQTSSVLDSIKGIGDKTKQKLLLHFKSVKRIEEAEVDEIAKIVGESKAKIVKEGLKEIKSIFHK